MIQKIKEFVESRNSLSAFPLEPFAEDWVEELLREIEIWTFHEIPIEEQDMVNDIFYRVIVLLQVLKPETHAWFFFDRFGFLLSELNAEPRSLNEERI